MPPSPSPGEPFSMQSIISCPLCTLQVPPTTVHLNVMIPGSTVCVCVRVRVRVRVCVFECLALICVCLNVCLSDRMCVLISV